MTENDLLDAVTNIGADVVQRFVAMDQRLAEKKEPTLQKTLLAAAACFLIIAGGAVFLPRLPAELGDAPSFPAPDAGSDGESLPTQYVIYCDPAAGDLGAEEMQAENVLFENAPHKDFSFAHKTNTERPSGTPDERTLILNGKTYSGQYSRTYETALAASEFFESYGRFHTYRSDTVSMDFRASTGELMLFTNFDEAARTARGDLTEREAKEITDALLRSLYGEEAATEYPHDTTLFTDSELGVFYSVVYRKQVWGMPTKDAIQISVNMQGEILDINAKYLGLFSLAETRLTEKNISDALAVLQSAFSQNWSILDTKLVMDAEGEYFLSALLEKSTPQGTDAMEVYISVLS